MKIPDIDKRTKADIVQSIRTLSAAYTPEWRFDEEYPDVGTALALIYAELFEGTIKQYNRVAEKNMIAFFNSVDARLLPAIPAAGYVRFGLAGKPQDGVPVPKGTQLVAESPDEEAGKLIFETCNDVYVSPAEIADIFYVNGARDTITRIYDKDAPGDFTLFDPHGENLQEHALYLCFTDALQITHASRITLEMWPYRQNHFPPRLLEGLVNDETALWEYDAGGEAGFVRFEREWLEERRFAFLKGENQPALAVAERFGATGCWMRCRVRDAQLFRNFSVERLALASRGEGIRPDVVNAVGIEQPLNGCFAFGEKMTVFSDLYFGSLEALGKRGAVTTLHFNLDFFKIPIDLEVSDPAINWKLVMQKTDFKLDYEYDITIEEVIWEYYNGKGWARLFPGSEYADVFGTAEGTTGQHRAITFRCPDDMTPFLLDAWESCFIRARILKINNAYKVRGHYISPYIAEISFDYDYTGRPVAPAFLCAVNNMAEAPVTPAMHSAPGFGFPPFLPLPSERAEIYVGFDVAPLDGPIKLLFTLKGTMREKPPRLEWEYHSRRGWRSLSIVDESESMRKTGIVTLMGNRDFEACSLWGRERFWLRLVDVSGRYNQAPVPELPTITGIYMNATQALNIETRAAETFTMEGRQEHFRCELIYERLYGVEVWVNELGDIEPRQLADWERMGYADTVRNVNGELTEAWVKWTEVEDFTAALPDDRVYMADKNQGVILFSDGERGRMPTSSHLNGIRVVYSTTDGDAGNLPAGSIVRTNRYIGFVNQVDNPEVISGGCDQETVSQAMARNAAALKHRYRGVTASDYEWLATEATRNILKAKCFGNRDDRGAYRPGSVTLVVLQKDYLSGRDFFSALQEQVFQYISARISGNVADLNHFHVIEPRFLELCVTVELAVSDFNRIFSVREQVQRRLDQFLDPVGGNFNGRGWQIGAIPNRTQILNCLKETPHVSFIKNILLTAYTFDAQGRIEADLDKKDEWIYGLPLSGRHQIEIKVE